MSGPRRFRVSPALLVASAGALGLSLAASACGSKSSHATSSSGSHGSTTASSTSGGAGGTGGLGGGGGSAPTSTSTSTTASSGAPVACTGTETSCQLGAQNGLCVDGVCTACQDPADDANCTSAYSTPSVCIGGSCVPGDCRKDTDCSPVGKLCGVDTPYTCAACANDTQCQAAYGTAMGICSTPGLCVSGACSTEGAACLANPADVCCSGQCLPGNCCTTSDCTAAQETCDTHVCTCAGASSSTYFVDPLHGNDMLGTGSSSTGGACAFRTIGRALAVIGATAPVGTRIFVMNTAVAGPAETYPLTVPSNVTIEGATAGTPTTITLAKGLNGFTLAAGVVLENLIIDGLGTSGIGVDVTTTSTTPATTILTNLTIENTGSHGIQATGNAVVSIRTNVKVSNSGTTAAPASGLFISGTAHVDVSLANGSVAAEFVGNTEAGIDVTAGGHITAEVPDGGTLDPMLVASGNAKAGILIGQTPSATLATNVLSNLEITGTTAGSGIQITGGSTLTLRHTTVSASSKNGVEIDTYGTGTSANNDMTHIDLGSATTGNGANTFQYAADAGASQNAGAGICVNILATAGQTLEAAGNRFSTADCSTSVATLVHTAATCAAHADYGINGTGATNKIVLTKCM